MEIILSIKKLGISFITNFKEKPIELNFLELENIFVSKLVEN